MASVWANHEKEMLVLWKMIKKSLLFGKFGSSTPSPNPNIISKAFFSTDLLSNTIKRWNQADFRYFDPYLDKIYGKNEVILVGKDIYYQNIILFV